MLEINNLTKKYGSFVALDRISMTCKAGNITVLLGENGAGKSTTIKSIASLLRFRGTIKICGYSNDSIEAKKCFAYVPEVPVLYESLTIKEHIEFISAAYEVDNGLEQAQQYLKLFNLEEKLNKTTKELSKGMKQKLSMLLALITNPKVLLVDEPLIGLDPNAIEDVLEIFKELRDQGVAILISTHIIDIMEEIYDEAFILKQGRILGDISKATSEESLKDIFFRLNGAKNEGTE